MKSSTYLFALVAIAFASFSWAANEASAEEVRVQNFVNDGNVQNPQPVDVRIVMVHLETSKMKVLDIKADQSKKVGTFKKGSWAVLITRKINNKHEYVEGGVAGILFPKTLLGLYNTGVATGTDSN